MKTICFFNNKGGVGKTTLTCNIAAQFAAAGQRVIVIDGDPQCNATQLILGDTQVLELYWPEDEATPKPPTLLDVVSPLQDGDSSIRTDVDPLPQSSNRFGVSLLPGHPKFSLTDDKLSLAWQETRSGDIGGFRKMNWGRTLCSAWGDNYDVAFIDIGPSLGPINRSFMLACDNFVTPLGADVFSLIGVRNIGDWLQDWISLYDSGVELCDRRTPGKLDSHGIARHLPIKKGYAGYTLQQYIAKSKAGVRRPTATFEKVIGHVPGEITKSLSPYLVEGLTAESAKLGDVPNMYSLIPLAQLANAPLNKLQASDGMVGSQFKQAEDYSNIYKSFAKRLAQNIGIDFGAQE